MNATIEDLRVDGAIAKLLKKYGLDPSVAEMGDPPTPNPYGYCPKSRTHGRRRVQ